MRLPPGPTLPSLLQLLLYTAWPFEFLERCSQRYGELFTVHLAGYGHFVTTSNPAHVEQIFKGDPAQLHSGEANDRLLRAALGSRSVLLLDDAPHARQRKLLLPPLHGDKMRAHFETMRQATLDVTALWPRGEPVIIDASTREITLRVIMQAVFGVEEAGQFEALARLLTDMLGTTATPLALVAPLIPEGMRSRFARWQKFLADAARARAQLAELVARGRASSPAALAGRPDVLAILLQARDAEGEPMDDEEICDELITLLLAGQDTTAAALSWAVREILDHPEVARRLTAEVTSGDPGRHDYLDAVVKETLRHRTIVPLVVRRLKAPLSLGGFELPAGISVAPCNHLVHHRADLYPKPEAFRPKRFLERKYSPFEWFPFGGADRRCLGMAFAMAEMKVVLQTLFSTLSLENRPGSTEQVRPTRRGVLLVPKVGTTVVVRDRLAAPPIQAVA